MNKSPIGIFDSGVGGLTVYQAIQSLCPQYDYIYLGDNARVPYGNRSFETVLEYTQEAVTYLLGQNCPLVILACNTASAKALRNIQQNFLAQNHPEERVLGVIRPTTEIIGTFTTSNKIGILATEGTVLSQSYVIEINKFFPEVVVFQQACPMWVPLIENDEYQNEGGQYFIEKYIDQLMEQCSDIDTLLLACTHYPLLADQIRAYLPEHIKVISQGDIVAASLLDYLHRHPEIDSRLSKTGTTTFLTTDSEHAFEEKARVFLREEIVARKVGLG